MANPHLLRTAREATRLTQKDIAERTGLDQADVSRWERGLRTPNDHQLRQLAETLRVPALLLQDGAIRVSQPVHRTARMDSKRTERMVDGRLELARIAASRILADIDIDSPFAFPNPDEPTPGHPEEAAEALRRVWRIPDGPVDNLTAHLEAAGAIVLRVDFGTDNILAAYNHVRGDHRWCFVNTRATDGARARFSVAHEVGHAILHWDRFDPPSGRDAEREAHHFAAALLMPRRDMLTTFAGRRLSLEELIPLRQHWKVSIQALITRAGELGMLSPNQKTRLWKQLSAKGWRRSEPGVIELEEPTIFHGALGIHRYDHRYSEAEIAELAGLSSDRLADLMPDYFMPKEPARPTLRLAPQRGANST